MNSKPVCLLLFVIASQLIEPFPVSSQGGSFYVDFIFMILLGSVISFFLQSSFYTVKKAVELLDGPSKNTFLQSNKYNSKVEIFY